MSYALVELSIVFGPEYAAVTGQSVRTLSPYGFYNL